LLEPLLPLDVPAVLLQVLVFLSPHIIDPFVRELGHARQKLDCLFAHLVGHLLELRLNDLLPKLFEAHTTPLLCAVGLAHAGKRILARGHVDGVVLVFLDLGKGPLAKDMVRKEGTVKLGWKFLLY